MIRASFNLCETFNKEKGGKVLKIGANTDEIMSFCERYTIPMYAIDDNGKTFQQYKHVHIVKN